MRDRFSEIEGAEIELIKSAGGVFEITLGGDLVFSKKKVGRFPSHDEVEAIAQDPRRSRVSGRA